MPYFIVRNASVICLSIALTHLPNGEQERYRASAASLRPPCSAQLMSQLKALAAQRANASGHMNANIYLRLEMRLLKSAPKFHFERQAWATSYTFGDRSGVATMRCN